MDFSFAKERAKVLLKDNWLVAFAFIFLFEIIVSIASSITSGIIAFILSVSFTIAINNVFIYAYLGKGYEISNFTKGFDKGISNRIALSALKNIFIVLWSLLFIIPGIVKGYSYMLADFISRENPEKSATECLDESRKLMDGHKMDMFLFDLSFFGWWILTILTCGILSIYVVPYYYQARIVYIDTNLYKLNEIDEGDIVIEVKDTVKYCHNCGKQLTKDETYCSSCGTKVK